MTVTAIAVTTLLMMTSWVLTSESKTVVFLPIPFTSHAGYHIKAARALGHKGHQVWVAMPTYLMDKGYLNVSGFNIIPYDTIPGLEESARSLLCDSYFKGEQERFFQFLELCSGVFDTLLRNESFISTVAQKKPDLIVIDNLPLFFAMSVLPYRLGVPFAFLGPVFYPPMLGLAFSPAEFPIGLLPHSNKMTFWQRLQNTLYFIFLGAYNPSVPIDAVSTYAPEMPYLPLGELVSRAEVFLVEQDHVMDYPRPTLPNIKLIGGMVAGPAQALPSEFRSFMDSAKEGVVIISFGGSYVLHLPQHISDKVLQVLLQLPMKSVFRSDLTSPDPKKILTSPWIPQNDLLGHAHTKVFVSHCGNSGQYEALYHAVPIVGTPLFLDQPYNAERARIKGFAEVLDLNTCTADQMKAAILTVATHPSYKQAAVKHSRLFRELYPAPADTAAFWLDHVMQYGGDYMRSAGQQMPVYQFLLLDVFLFVACLVMLTTGMVCVLARALWRCLCNRKPKAD